MPRRRLLLYRFTIGGSCLWISLLALVLVTYLESNIWQPQSRLAMAWLEIGYSSSDSMGYGRWNTSGSAVGLTTGNDSIIHNNKDNHTATTRDNTDTDSTVTKDPVVFGAYFPNGRLGYVADPTAVSWHFQMYFQQTNASFETMLLEYQVDPLDNQTALMPTCHEPAGFLDEAPEGVELLTRQIRLAKASNTTTTRNSSRPIRLLCVIYTHPPMHSLARVAALTYGRDCDGFLAFSTETIPELGFVHLHHTGPESYGNMYQKVRSIWAYVRKHYSQDYDYFHLGGDDMYVIVENMRQFLAGLPIDRPLHLGQWVRQQNHPYVAGGGGYTLNRQALMELVDRSLPKCHVDTIAPYEDKLISQCLRDIGIYPHDARHFDTGQQRYHAAQPATIYKSRPKSGRGASFQARAQAYFESLPHPSRLAGTNETVGPQYGLDAAASDSVSFHNLHHAVYMARVHAILHRTCPRDSLLEVSLQQWEKQPPLPSV